MSPLSPLIIRGFPCRVKRIDDLVYSSQHGRPLLADLYLPEEPPRPLPVVLYLHSGGWLRGDRRTCPDLARFFAERGIAMLSIDYRLSDEAIFPAALDDVFAAIEWVRSEGPSHGLDPEHLGIWGASAGGHLASLAVLSEPETKVRCVVAAYPPVDFYQLPERAFAADSYESRFLGAPIREVPELVAKANPVTYARPGAPPFLIVHGRNDKLVPLNQSELLYEALRAHGNQVTLSVIDGLNHAFLEDNNFDQGPPLRHLVRSTGRDEPTEAPPFTFGTLESFFRRNL